MVGYRNRIVGLAVGLLVLAWNTPVLQRLFDERGRTMRFSHYVILTGDPDVMYKVKVPTEDYPTLKEFMQMFSATEWQLLSNENTSALYNGAWRELDGQVAVNVDACRVVYRLPDDTDEVQAPDYLPDWMTNG